MRRGAAALFAAFVGSLVAVPGLASADGEVGLVIQIGDQVTTHCVAYSGDAITGEQALSRAGYTFEQLGGGSRAVCAINDVGCFDASSFSSCFCECQGRDCTYWGFFTREYGAGWVYSTLGFNLIRATDGDVHGWKWGTGGPASAPAPVDVPFEQICGHAPQSLNPPTVTPTATNTTAATPSAGGLSTVTAGPSAASSVTATTVATVALTSDAATATPTATEAPSVVVTIGNTPAPPATADSDEDGGGGNGGLIAAGVIVIGLLAAIGGAAVWRQRRGA